MAGPGRRRRRVHWVAPGDGADHITALPLELRARIASFLRFRQVAQLSALSRPWRHIHRHTPVVNVKLADFLSLTEEMLDVLNEDALARLEVALLRRGQERSGSKVDTLRISCNVDDPRIRRHAGLIIALADARRICILTPRFCRLPMDTWPVDLSPAARVLEVGAIGRPAPTVAGPGAAALQTT
ncbi:hypothetical protein BAE44_0017593 [Dichanthelium oligosanthes]|uniref:F-box domain-containing protein n=1 Tax=Dichanthelium oligosanthes TaxID=888268 RepID=A0A1E5V8A8_9POAL|nr:hypothetical protein BAE44_0017593 [Dichanthelium oligosanthes]